jgi:hypothetical protein
MNAQKTAYYVSSRPEAYEYWGEVDLEKARRIGELIARRAARRFPGIEFRVDDDWHEHLPETALVAAYIDAHWLQWLEEEEKASKAA